MSTKRKIFNAKDGSGAVSLNNVVERYEKYSLSAAKGAIQLQKYKVGSEAYCVKVISASSRLSIPAALMKISKLKGGDQVMVYADSNRIILYNDLFSGDFREFRMGQTERFSFVKEKKLSERADVIYKKMTKSSTVSIRECAESMRIPKDSYVVCSYFRHDNRCWLEIKRLNPQKDATLSYLKGVQLMKHAMRKDKLNGLTYKVKLSGYSMLLGSLFCSEFKNAPNPVLIPMWKDIKRGVIIIEAPEKTCAVCGDVIHSTDVQSVISSCPDCQKRLGQGKDIHKLSEAMSVIEAAKAAR